MNNINRVELQGVVGTVRTIKDADTKVVRMSVATNYACKDKDKNAFIETTWHNVTAWESKNISLENIVKGAQVHLTGRLRTMLYTEQDGTERTIVEIKADHLEVVNQKK